MSSPLRAHRHGAIAESRTKTESMAAARGGAAGHIVRAISVDQALAGARSGAVPPHLLPGIPDKRGRVRIHLGRGHPLAQKSGQQWRSRYVAMVELGRILRDDEHVHHIDLNKSNDRPDNLEVLIAEFHGSLHCALTPIARYVPNPLIGGGLHPFEPRTSDTFAGSRRGAVISADFRGRGSRFASGGQR